MPTWGDDHNGDVLLPWLRARNGSQHESGFSAPNPAFDEGAAYLLQPEDDAMKPEENPRNLEASEQADDVATLYSWANLHGAKYRDFSASRQEMRAQMRQRNLADRARMAREEAQAPPPPALTEGP